jgi:hypothetical protein
MVSAHLDVSKSGGGTQVTVWSDLLCNATQRWDVTVLKAWRW